MGTAGAVCVLAECGIVRCDGGEWRVAGVIGVSLDVEDGLEECLCRDGTARVQTRSVALNSMRWGIARQ